MIDFKAPCMLLNEYQRRASRTINHKLKQTEQRLHALHGIVGEIGEIHSLFQKVYQGHELDVEHLKKEIGDMLWFVAELCTSFGFTLGEVAEMNIQKLEARYPDGFETDKSLHRAEGDI